MSDRKVTDNAELRRYEILVDGAVAGYAEYTLRATDGRDGAPDGPQVVFTHTEVGSAYEGQGLGGALARGALDDVRARGGSVVPMCPFLRRYISRHPEYQDMVTE